MKEITKTVAEVFGIEYHLLFTKTRKRNVVVARQVAMYVIKKKVDTNSLANIGAFFNKDHATVLHAIRTVDNLMENYKDFEIKVKVALTKCEKLPYGKKVVYIAHPISGDVDGNVNKILQIVKSINFLNPNVIPFVPYLSDVLALDDTIPEQREKGISNNLHYLELGFVSELWIYGNVISEGIQQEIEVAQRQGIEVIFKK